MKYLLSLAFLFIAVFSFAQTTYISRSHKDRYYFVVQPDTIQFIHYKVKRYHTSCPTHEIITFKDGKAEEQLSKLKTCKITFEKDQYTLHVGSKKHNFKLARNEKWRFYQKDVYESEQRERFFALKDSLSFGEITDTIEPQNWEYEKLDDSTNYTSFVNGIDHSYDSISKLLAHFSGTTVGPYYKQTVQHFAASDSTAVFHLLENISSNRTYSDYYVVQLAMDKPDLLIRYVDKWNPNTQIICKSIRTHPEYENVVNNIRKSTLETAGKKMLVKQYKLRRRHNAFRKAVTVANILGQTALTVGVLLWIF